jgi:hypothetical protein
MSKIQKQEEQPSIRDAARSFVEAIIAERKAFKRMYRVFRWMKQEERNETDE